MITFNITTILLSFYTSVNCGDWSYLRQSVEEDGYLDLGERKQQMNKENKEDRHGLYCSPDAVKVIKWRRIKWGNVKRIEETANAYKNLVGLFSIRDNRWDDDDDYDDVDWI